VKNANLVLNLDPGAVLACVEMYGDSILLGGAPNVTVNHGTIAYSRNSSGAARGVHLYRTACGWTFNHTIFHDNDDGLIAEACAGTTLTLNDVGFDHNGEVVGGQSAATHNLYLSGVASASDTEGVVIKGGYSVCPRDTTSPGFAYKIRWSSATITGSMISTNDSTLGFKDCTSSADMDFSCGGVDLIGKEGPGNGNTILLGTRLSTPNGAIRWNSETNSTVNCPPGNASFVATISNSSGTGAGNILSVTHMNVGRLMVGEAISGPFSSTTITGYGTGSGGVGTYAVSQSLHIASRTLYVAGWPSNSLSITNNIIINDNPSDLTVTSILWKPASLAVARGNWIICNGVQQCTFQHMFPGGVIDGGGNIFFGGNGKFLSGRAQAAAALKWKGVDWVGNKDRLAAYWMPPHP
jgi:hypothetical protein